MAHVLGIDIGGTSIKAGLFAEGGRLLDVRQIPTGSLVCAEAFAGVVTGLRELCSVNDVDEGDVRAVGLDVPGPVDDQGRVGMLPNIELDPDGLQDAIVSHFSGAALAFVNDANAAAALGELWQGSAKGVGSFVLVTLGTGVGGGVVAGGHLVSGASGAAGRSATSRSTPRRSVPAAVVARAVWSSTRPPRASSVCIGRSSRAAASRARAFGMTPTPSPCSRRRAQVMRLPCVRSIPCAITWGSR